MVDESESQSNHDLSPAFNFKKDGNKSEDKEEEKGDADPFDKADDVVIQNTDEEE